MGAIRRIETRIRRQAAFAASIGLFLAVVIGEVGASLMAPDGLNYMPFGYDFPAFWVAARLFLTEGIAGVYDVEAFIALQLPLAPQESVLLWHYPPTYLAMVMPLGWLSYPVALLSFTTLGLALWAMTVRYYRAVPQPLGWVVLFGAPAVVLTLIQGQNGLIFAALSGLAFQARAKGRLWLAACLIALGLGKPHLSILVPVALIAARDWPLFWRCCVTCLGLLGAVTLLLGADVWLAALNNTPLLRVAMATGDLWAQQVTAYVALKMLGAGNGLALVAQAISAMVAIVAVADVWRRREVVADLKLAMLFLATLLVSPYAFRYDMVLTLLGLSLLAQVLLRRGMRPGDKLIMLLVWIAPALSPALAVALGLQIGPLVMALGVALCWREAVVERRLA
ncbi:glycosyltransferase family 87 protein [Algicella marina]|uniref:DUF2029 domain-containing protein n=1 Tax=Algicella marina TaxID=2683284 RepID=A0A6P1SXL2_9RHOB|nr:glycosyltransferase family 87 protein [Algicella marina]QHQ35198.1 DUF2029 domain-containing protein [Algicella marina]